MTARDQLAGPLWFLSSQKVPLQAGVLTGIYLSCDFVAWLVLANRVHELEPYAFVRNFVGGVILVLLLAIPVFRFRRQPGKLFLAGLTAWTVLTIIYIGAEFYFSLLKSRMGGLHVFMLGVVSYGFVAVFQWVFLLCAEVRHRHVAESHVTADAGSPSTPGGLTTSGRPRTD